MNVITQNARVLPAPIINEESKPWWDAVQQRKFLYKRCAACGENHFYPRSLCPHCLSDRTEWREASGRATLYTHSTMRRAKPPYTLAYVQLEEGPFVMTNLVDCDDTRLAPGQAMRVVYRAAEDGMLVPLWTSA